MSRRPAPAVNAPPPAADRPVTATYRLQIHHEFPLAAATEVVAYLDALGVSHVYSSPLLHARSGSLHGYDVVDPAHLNPQLGDEESLRAFVAGLHGRGMGLILDIVPNHMAIGQENRYWQDVLTHGRASPYASWFDIDWDVAPRALRGRIVLAALGEPLDAALSEGKLGLAVENGVTCIAYGEQRFPLDPATLPDVIAYRMDELRSLLGDEHAVVAELDEIVDELASLPERWTGDAPTAAERRARAEAATARLASLLARSDAVRAHFDRAVREFGRGSEGAQRLRTLLSLQAYQLAYWRDGTRRLNYRRFFDVSDLAGIRVGYPAVFEATHRRILEWVGAGYLDGLRIDHIDGLRDPAGYLTRLDESLRRRRPDRAPFILVEKILTGRERLRDTWPVAGTTGYDFLNEVEILFVSPEGMDRLERHFAKLSGGRSERLDFEGLAIECKRRVLTSALHPDVDRVTRVLERIASAAGAASEEREEAPRLDERIGIARLRAAVTALAAAFPVYRTYFGSAEGPHPDDRAAVDRAIAAAGHHLHSRHDDLVLVGDILAASPESAAEPAAAAADPWREFVERFQQLTGPAAAKGIEDTALYRDVRLASLCEVGGTPDRPIDDAVERFHAANAHRAARWPAAMLAVTTHDTKRSGDARARLDVLSEVAEQWIELTQRWRQRHRRHATPVDRRTIPDAVTEYLLYQSVLAIWPPGTDGVDRIQAYLLKAAREAKSRTSWLEANERSEQAMRSFVAAVLADPEFRAEMDELARIVAPAGRWNALSRTVLHLGSPGVADFYQGDELWNHCLVDPDNRRPVDYAARAARLEEIRRRADGASPESITRWVGELVATAEDGVIKMLVIRQALHARRRYPRLFVGGSYRPLGAAGARAAHVIAFERAHEDARALVIAPRLIHRMTGGEPPTGPRWGDTRIEVGESRAWRCALSGRRLEGTSSVTVSDALGTAPVGLFISTPDDR